MENDVIEIREVKPDDRQWIKDLLTKRWRSAKIITRGKIHNALNLPGLAAVSGEKPAGLLTYRVENNECEIITFDAIEQGKGVGSLLISSIINKAKDKHWKRLWLITTNDNLEAQEFYKKKGFLVTAVYKNAIDESRKLKPEIPLIGQNEIPIKDEIEFELKLK